MILENKIDHPIDQWVIRTPASSSSDQIESGEVSCGIVNYLYYFDRDDHEYHYESD